MNFNINSYKKNTIFSLNYRMTKVLLNSFITDVIICYHVLYFIHSKPRDFDKRPQF